MPFTFLGELQRKVHHFISLRSLCAHRCVVSGQSLGIDFFRLLASPRPAVDLWPGHIAAGVHVQHIPPDG
jgi:hypothetical protein